MLTRKRVYICDHCGAVALEKHITYLRELLTVG